MMKLTDRQFVALHALAYPQSITGQLFWAEAHARWQGPRKTLGSLEHRGLASYDAHGWAITDAGRRAFTKKN